MQAATVEIKMSKGHCTLQALGQTPRGRRYIKGRKTLKAVSMASPEFKAEMTAAVEEILGSEA